MVKILVVEDNIDINALIARALTGAGYQTVSAFDGVVALEKVHSDREIALVLLDIMIPLKSGEQVLKELRAFSSLPVIMVSAKDMVSTKIGLLQLGADDYITKPFDINELIARVSTVLRRRKSELREEEKPAPDIITHKDITLDKNRKTVTVRGVRLDLTAKEYLILELLLLIPGKVYSKSTLYEFVWGEQYISDDGAIKTHMSNLRAKLAAASDGEYLETVWGLGYRVKL